MKKADFKKHIHAKLERVQASFKKTAKRGAARIKELHAAVRSFPAWAKRRPAAVKQWRSENRKKKKYHSFKLEKKIKPEPRNIPTAWQLTRQSMSFYKKHFWVFAWLSCIQVGLYGLLVYGPTDFDLKSVQESIQALFGGDASSAAGTLALFGSVIGAQTQREGAAFFNFLVYLIMSLAIVWIIRRLHASQPFNLRDAFYSGMGPAIPVVLILLVMSLQSLPFTITSYIYVVGRTNNIFISGLEDLLFFLIALSAGLFSLYLMTPAILSLYAATLPNMYPLKTIRLTKKIVAFRRFLVFRRIVALPFLVAVCFALLLLLLLRFYPQGGIWFVQLFPIFILPLIHMYLFKLYRSLV